MPLLELTCIAIVVLYVTVRARRDDDPIGFLRRLGLLVTAAWIGENTVIHAYGFYAYSPRWSLFIDRVPALIILIWPVVIHSAWDLAKRLRPTSSAIWSVALTGGGLVFCDAWLIEPIAVQAKLWRWTEPGLFAVPPIGVLGWAYFATVCIALFETADRNETKRAPLIEALVLLIPPIATHATLIVTWWGALRWINATVPPWPAAALAAFASLTLTMLALRAKGPRQIPRVELLLRIPAASFFFVLLAIHARQNPALITWSLTFAPPYLALTAVAASNPRQ